MRNHISRILALLLVPVLLNAETIYVSHSGSGDGSGSGTGNRMSAAGFNTAGNWNASVANDGKIGPGDTVSLGGTITNALVLQNSGLSGNVITILFETGAMISAPYFDINGAINGSTNDHIVIDGGNTVRVGTRWNPYDTNQQGFRTNIQCTHNGEALTYQQATRGIVFSGATNIIVKNLRTQNLYVKVPLSANTLEHGGAISIGGFGSLMISNCVTHMGIDGPIVKAEVTNVLGLVVADCDIRQVSNGIKPGCASGTCSYTDAQIVRNRVDELGMWSDSAGGAGHHHNDGIQLILGSPGANALRTVIAYNWLGPDMGAYGHTTSAIFCEDDSQETLIYNNLVTLSPGHWTSNPLIQGGQTTSWSAGQGVGLIANNTIIGEGSGSGIYSRHHAVSNNIVYNVGNFFTRETISNTGTNDYNVVYGPSGDTDGQCYNPDIGIYGSLTSWQGAAAAQDQNSILQDPLVNSDGTLQSGSPARGFGKNLSAVFTDDFNGNPRVNWDAGAFEFVPTSASVPAVVAPGGPKRIGGGF